MKKSLALVLVLSFSGMVTALVIQSILELLADISNKPSSVSFEEIENGIYDSSVLLVAAFGHSVDLSVNSTNCSCYRIFQNILEKDEICEVVEAELPTSGSVLFYTSC